MKAVIKQVIVAVIIVAFVAFGCKPQPAEKLIRKWKPVDATGDSITKEIKQDILKEGIAMEFRRDGQFISFSASRGADTGSYKLSDDGKMVLIQSANHRQIKLKIAELKTNRLIIENQGIVMVMEPVR
jgi:hypothetical protein